MTEIKSRVALAIAIVLVGFAGWFGTKHSRCKQRNAEFSRRIAVVERDAREQLKVGTTKGAVAQFYNEHKIPFDVVKFDDAGFQAIGTLSTTGGCAPLACGDNSALIGVRVEVDANGAVTGEPKVVSMYTDCL
jgi:hypothetical protein